MLILAGIAGFFINVVPFHHEEQVAKIGSLTATQDKETDLAVPRYTGPIMMVVGAALVFAGRKRG